MNGQESRNNRVHKSFTKNTLVDLTWFDLIENNCDLNDTEQPVTAAHHHIKVPSSATIVPQQSSFNITATRQGLITICTQVFTVKQCSKTWFHMVKLAFKWQGHIPGFQYKCITHKNIKI